MNSKAELALSEFSKGHWAAVPSDEPPLHPSELNLVTKVLSWLGKLAPLVFARYLITFFIGVAATLTWQSYGGAAREQTIAAAPRSLDLCGSKASKSSPSRSQAAGGGAGHPRQDVNTCATAGRCLGTQSRAATVANVAAAVILRTGRSGFVPRLWPMR